MNDVEKKLKETKLPDIRLEAHRRTFFKYLFAKQAPASFGFYPMVRIREIVMILLIVALTVINILDIGGGGLPQSELALAAQIKEVQDKVAEVSETVTEVEESIAALRPDHLVIIPLYNGVGNRTGEAGNYNGWVLIPEYEPKLALFAVLPAGTPPYTWSVDDPGIINLSLTPEGFIAKGKITRSGRTVLRVKDSSGLTGTLPITTESMGAPPETKQAN